MFSHAFRQLNNSPPPSVAGRKIVVLGSTGFLGRHLADGLAASGAEVMRLCRSPKAGENAVFLDLLAAPPRQVAQLFDLFGAEVVVNAAGVVWTPTQTPVRAGNAEITARLLQALTSLEARPRLVHLGSIHEYGPGTPGTGIREDQHPAPVTHYGLDKLAATCLVLAAARSSNLDCVVLRLANVAGSDPPPGSIFGKVVAHLGAAADFRLRGTEPPPLKLPYLSAHRDIVDVRDVLTAIVGAVAATAETVSGQVINIGSGHATAMRDLVERMVSLTGEPLPVVAVPDGSLARDDIWWQQFDITRAERLLSWRPVYSLDDTLRSVLADCQATPEPTG